MKTLSIDIETYSDEPLQKTGVYRYVESPNFEILLFARDFAFKTKYGIKITVFLCINNQKGHLFVYNYVTTTQNERRCP